MAKEALKQVFLSASIPLEGRDPRFFATADVIAIRDSVRALASIVIPKGQLIWGGHPAITPLIRYVLQRMNGDVKQHVRLYQSKFFEKFFPEDNYSFEDIQLCDASDSREKSLEKMRTDMIANNKFSAAIFIGGMDGVLEEYEMFTKYHPGVPAFPIASTGAASKLLYDEYWKGEKRDVRLESNYAYMSLFQDLFKEFI